MKPDMQERLRQELAAKAGNASIRLPKEISFDKEGSVHRLHLSNAAVTANMPKDPTAFEGWALAMKALLGESVCQSIQLSWDAPDDLKDKNYQRFLYRLIRFCRQVDWLTIVPACKSLLLASRVLNPDGSPVRDTAFFVNSPSSSREMGVGAGTESMFAQEEHYLELLFCEEPSELLRAISWKGNMQRQLPVGLFEGTVSKSTQVFTGSKSAIDLWASDPDKGIAVFELKTPDNCKIGAISELFFYTCLIRDATDGIFQFKGEGKTEKSIRDAKQVSGFIVSGRIHPLLDNEKLFEILNSAFASRGMRFGYIEYDDDLHVRRVVPRK
jgi:hypothetical protein